MATATRSAPKVTFKWNGPAVLGLIRGAQREGLEARARIVAAELRANIHRQTGQMAEQAFARVEEQGGRLVLVAGSTAPHAVYEELGTSRRPGHPVIRQTMDANVKQVPADIARALGRRGLGLLRGGR